MLIDTHCHLDFSVFSKHRESILTTCEKKSITGIVIPGVCARDWQRILELCQQYKALYPALGLHPCFLSEHQQSDLQELDKICATQDILAIGEIGLDYYKGKNNHLPDKSKQKWYFSEQLKIAKKYQLPVLIHARRSHNDVLEELKNIQPVSGIIHAYSGSYEQAKEYLKLGFKLGFGGAYTYPKATKLRSLVARLPLYAWVLETDAPDMSPIKHYGQTNSPEYLAEIAQEFIKVYDESDHPTLNAQQIISQLYNNSCEVLVLT